MSKGKWWNVIIWRRTLSFCQWHLLSTNIYIWRFSIIFVFHGHFFRIIHTYWWKPKRPGFKLQVLDRNMSKAMVTNNMTPYDFSNVHLTGKFEKRPGTGRLLMFFSVRGHKLNGRRPASVHNNIGRCPAGHHATSYGDLIKADTDSYLSSTTNDRTYLLTSSYITVSTQ